MATDFTQDANIISWWYLEEADTTWYDGSANNNDLAPTNSGHAPARTTTHIQGTYAADFEAGDSDCIYRADADLSPATFPGKSTTGGQSAVSAVAWIRLESTGSAGGIVSKGSIDDGEKLSWALIYDGTHIKAEISSVGWAVSASVTGATELSTNTWYHVAIVYTGAELQLWLGTESGTSSQDNTAASSSISLYRGTGAFYVGARRMGGGTPFDGIIDEVAVFADALSGTEINAIRTDRLDGSAGAAASSTSSITKIMNYLRQMRGN